MIEIGHNSAAFNQTLRADIEALLNEDTERLFIYAQWHVNDYIAGTMGMSLEHEGAYQRFLMRLYARGKPLPDDDEFMAKVMSLSRTIWRRIKGALVAAGKIIVKAGCLTNPRFEKERIKRAEQLVKKSAAAQQRWRMERENNAEKERDAKRLLENSGKNLPEISGKIPEEKELEPNKINGSAHAHAYANQYPITNNKAASLQRERTKEDYDALAEKLFAAGGDALSDASPAFIAIAEPIRWLENDCDLELDILPTIKRLVHRKRRNEIQGWWYFTDAVREARDRRLTPMPAPQLALPAPAAHSEPGWIIEKRAAKQRFDDGMKRALEIVAKEGRGRS